METPSQTDVLRRMVELMLRHQNELLKQQRRETTWKNIRWMLVTFGILAFAGIYWAGFTKLANMGSLAAPDGDYVSLVRIEGLIAPGRPASADKIVTALKEAFEDDKAKGVLLQINSPGGTPTQANLIYRTIIALKKEHPDKRIITVGLDTVASGAYYVASATDKIYVDDNSVIGSIGVRMDGFGLVEAARRLGIERRLFTAGAHKVRVDPFKPLSDDDRQRVMHMLEAIHKNFIAAVRQGRGNRLKGTDQELFNGDVWVGQEAVSLGLADGIATPEQTIRQEFGVENFRDYTPATPLVERLRRSFSAAVTSLIPGTTGPSLVWY
ncbi:S49 family peptidase [Candidatus Parcubacteria bacterium]|nr:MAG: S49 family peptidase [Candidatus Parcubacteria bacterium]